MHVKITEKRAGISWRSDRPPMGGASIDDERGRTKVSGLTAFPLCSFLFGASSDVLYIMFMVGDHISRG